MKTVEFILWTFIGLVNLFIVKDISALSYALIWVVLLLKIISQ